MDDINIEDFGHTIHIIGIKMECHQYFSDVLLSVPTRSEQIILFRYFFFIQVKGVVCQKV